MRYRSAHSLHFVYDPTKMIELPFEHELDGKTIEVEKLNEDGKTAHAFVEGSVDRNALTTARGPRSLGGSKPAVGIVVCEATQFARCLRRFVNVLAFLADIPIRLSSRLGQDRLIPEGPEDEALSLRGAGLLGGPAAATP